MMSATALIDVRKSRTQQTFLQYLNRLAAVESAVIEDLENQSDHQILLTRSKARMLESAAWRIECACDYILLNREPIPHRARGRGHKDIEGRGWNANAAKRAKEVGCLPRQIEKNSQIFKLILEIKNTVPSDGILETLKEKSFYYAALSAADPIEALSEFTLKRQANPKFRVTDAYRLLMSEGKTKNQIARHAVQKFERRDLLTHLRKARHVLQQLMKECPDSKLAKKLYSDSLTNINDEIREMFDEDAADLLCKAWEDNNHNERQLSLATGLPKDVVSRLMGRMSEEGKFIVVPQSTNGSTPKVWHRVGKALPPELRTKRPSKYHDTEAW
jgi:hypothetical protein